MNFSIYSRERYIIVDHSIFQRLLARLSFDNVCRQVSSSKIRSPRCSINFSKFTHHDELSHIITAFGMNTKYGYKSAVDRNKKWISDKHRICSPLLFRDAIASFISHGRNRFFAMTAFRRWKMSILARDESRSKSSRHRCVEKSEAMYQWQSPYSGGRSLPAPAGNGSSIYNRSD